MSATYRLYTAVIQRELLQRRLYVYRYFGGKHIRPRQFSKRSMPDESCPV